MSFPLRPVAFAFPIALVLATMTGCISGGRASDATAHSGGSGSPGGHSEAVSERAAERAYNPHDFDRRAAHREMPAFREPSRELQCWRCGH